ncbi:LLM class flavin-dependent oxidoreductase [Streptomyces sp. NPDC001480]|uniref:LLM class flavin-dependent oxidoreductase n=1 Tax=Streptomyces sp. NPDC001480 TaxID=3364577 RepID=UPI0036B57D3F
MWDPDTDGPFEGRHYRLAETLCVPTPVSDPHPEIMIGGGGEKKTLRLVARYADACNLVPASPGELRHKLDVLRGHCDTVGRDYDAVRKTIAYTGEPATTGHHRRPRRLHPGHRGLHEAGRRHGDPGPAPRRDGRVDGAVRRTGRRAAGRARLTR